MGKVETRSKILASAFECFSARDYHEVKIIDIAIQAGLGKGTIYEYFSSKEELFKELFKFISDTYKSQMQEVLIGDSTSENKLIALYERHLVLHEEMKNRANGIVLMQKILSLELQDDMYANRLEMMALFSGVIEEGIAKKEIRSDVDRQTLLLHLLVGLPAICILFEQDKSNPKDRAERYIHLLFQGIRA